MDYRVFGQSLFKSTSVHSYIPLEERRSGLVEVQVLGREVEEDDLHLCVVSKGLHDWREGLSQGYSS